MSGWPARAREQARRDRLISPGDRILIAVSGGADSVVLLHWLAGFAPSMRLRLYAFHLNHQLRADAGEDASFVEALGARLGVETLVERRDVRRLCRAAGWSLEDGARRIRYEALAQAAERLAASKVAVAHTADDQAETVLLRLLRGSGLTGLGGIPRQRPLGGHATVIRPLLGVWRRDVLAYLKAHGLPHRQDPSNEDRAFLRNRIRHELLPHLEAEYHPRLREAMVQLAEQCRMDAAYLEAAAGRVHRRLVKRAGPAEVAVTIDRFARLPQALQRQLVRQVVRQLRGTLQEFEFRHWRDVAALFEGRHGLAVHLPGGLEWRRRGRTVVCRGPTEGLVAPVDEEYTRGTLP
jgi:tRNA(Ile)-lysidine synthase